MGGCWGIEERPCRPWLPLTASKSRSNSLPERCFRSFVVLSRVCPSQQPQTSCKPGAARAASEGGIPQEYLGAWRAQHQACLSTGAAEFVQISVATIDLGERMGPSPRPFAPGTSTRKTGRNFNDPDSHLMQPGGVVPPGLQLPAGGGSRPPGDRGGGREQPAAGCRASGADPTVNRCHGRFTAECKADRSGLLEQRQRQGLQRSGHRRLHRHRPPAARAATTAAARAAAQRCRCENPHGPQAQKQAGLSDLRPAQGDRGAGERPDQGRPGHPSLPAAGPGEGRWRVAPDRGHPQSAQVVQAPAITAAGAMGSHRMRGDGPGGISQGCIGRRPRTQPAEDQLSSGIRRVRRAAALSATNS